MSNIFKRQAERARARANAETTKENMKAIVYPFIKEVCESFDITVLDDLSQTHNPQNAECPESYGADSECTCMTTPVYALGWHGEPNAGIRYGVVSPWFDNVNQLEAFCERNIERFREESKKCDDGAPIPDATDWK